MLGAGPEWQTRGACFRLYKFEVVRRGNMLGWVLNGRRVGCTSPIDTLDRLKKNNLFFTAASVVFCSQYFHLGIGS